MRKKKAPLGPFFIELKLFLSRLLIYHAWRLSRANKAFETFYKRLSNNHTVPEGWDVALLIPVLLFLGRLSFCVSHPLEVWFFVGDMRVWLTSEMGVDFDQRNSIIVDLAMGFAVIRTIFSIAEDAIFSVPKHLTCGSLALGATPRQTMVRVVLVTANPGFFPL